jgi:MFS family permease
MSGKRTYAIGNTIEYYDFTLYATATALVFNKVFFPNFDPLVGSLAAFATFFIGYCARPLGGILFGLFGDRIGRKTALLATMLIMGIGTFLISTLPAPPASLVPPTMTAAMTSSSSPSPTEALPELSRVASMMPPKAASICTTTKTPMRMRAVFTP